jgi:hypothetical protein
MRFHSDLVPAGPRDDVGTIGTTAAFDLRAVCLVRAIPLYMGLWKGLYVGDDGDGGNSMARFK